MVQIDGTAEEQAWCLPVLSEVMMRKATIEDELELMDKVRETEFLVTKTVANKEVWENMRDWEPSVRAKFEQLVNQKKAVRQMSRSQLQALATERALPIELLLANMVHARKANGGAYRSRAVVCGNYQETNAEDRYAGGADGTKLTAMEILAIFRHFGLADVNDVCVIEKALYGLVSSARDWGIHRDHVVPTLRWQRTVEENTMEGRFVHLWRLIETNVNTGEEHWVGLMSVYVDDIFVAAAKEVAQATTGSVEKTWDISGVEWASDTPLRHCMRLWGDSG